MAGRILTDEEAGRTQRVVTHVENRNPYLKARRKERRRRSPQCAYYWEFEISGGNPSSGSQVWSVTLDGDTQDVTVAFNMTASGLTIHLLAQFSGMSSDDVDTEGGPLPEIPLTVKWKKRFSGHASSDWPPTVGSNTLNNEGWMKVRQINPR